MAAAASAGAEVADLEAVAEEVTEEAEVASVVAAGAAAVVVLRSEVEVRFAKGLFLSSGLAH